MIHAFNHGNICLLVGQPVFRLDCSATHAFPQVSVRHGGV